MRRIKGLDAGLGQAMADIYTRSPEAAAVAAMARHLGLGEVRLAGTTPYLTYVVSAAPGPSVDALGAYASVVMEAVVTVLSLPTLPEWRRAAVWETAPVVKVPPDETPISRATDKIRQVADADPDSLTAESDA